MMIRVLVALGLGLACAAGVASAADLPLLIEKKAIIHHQKTSVHPKIATLHPKMVAHLVKKTSDKPQLVAVLPAATKPSPIVKAPAPVLREVPTTLTWVLGPMVANADGGKGEGSASATGNIVVDKPGTSFGPEMVVELEGHVVKTAQSTVRLDIHIGSFQKSVLWSSDEIKSGKFKITLNEKVPAGVMPAYIPVTALAFVTKAGEGHVAMVSLEKIVLRLGGMQVIGTK